MQYLRVGTDLNSFGKPFALLFSSRGIGLTYSRWEPTVPNGTMYSGVGSLPHMRKIKSVVNMNLPHSMPLAVQK